MESSSPTAPQAYQAPVYELPYEIFVQQHTAATRPRFSIEEASREIVVSPALPVGFRGIRVENKLTREFWHFDRVDALQNVGEAFAFVGRQWTPGIYQIDNRTDEDLEVIGGGIVRAGRVAILRAHGHGI